MGLKQCIITLKTSGVCVSAPTGKSQFELLSVKRQPTALNHGVFVCVRNFLLGQSLTTKNIC